MPTIFIDGQEGTTGLQLQTRLQGRSDLTLLTLPDALRKDVDARAECLNAADIVFLCLPDDAAREAVSMVRNPHTRVLDASTAHRITPGWAYGFPELSPKHREAIATSRRITVPGCYATGFLAIVYPLIQLGILAPETLLTCHGISGYSGAGKRGIAEYEAPDRSVDYDSPRLYGLGQTHKHLPEMTKIAGLVTPPVFNPIICDFYAGMAVSVPLHASAAHLMKMFSEYYAGMTFISVHETDGFLPANLLTGSNELRIYVCGNEERLTCISVLDNLGKGSSGAAVQCMNIALNLPEETGL